VSRSGSLHPSELEAISSHVPSCFVSVCPSESEAVSPSLRIPSHTVSMHQNRLIFHHNWSLHMHQNPMPYLLQLNLPRAPPQYIPPIPCPCFYHHRPSRNQVQCIPSNRLYSHLPRTSTLSGTACLSAPMVTVVPLIRYLYQVCHLLWSVCRLQASPPLLNLIIY
jgi:hypothetical protein